MLEDVTNPGRYEAHLALIGVGHGPTDLEVSLPFDPFAWGLGLALNRLTARVLRLSGADELRQKLFVATEEWAQQLPTHASTNCHAIFIEVAAEPDPESRPARFRLQEALYSAGVAPTEKEWADAFVEHWEVRRAELGVDANPFFRLSRDQATTHLADLARRIHRVCQADPELARRTIVLKLDQILEGQEADRAARQRSASIPYYARDLPARVHDLIVDRPDAWEYRLFSDVLSHEILLHTSLQRDYDSGAAWGKAIAFKNPRELIDWLQTHLAEAERFGSRVTSLLNEQLPIAFGPPGVSGEPEAIVDVARKLGEVHRCAIEWALTLRRSVTHPVFELVMQLVERLAEDIVRQIRDFSHSVATTLEQALACPDKDKGPTVVTLTLTLSVPEGVPEQLEKEFARLRGYFEEHPWELI